MDRRTVLKIAGGGVILSAAALAGFSATRRPARALQAWGDAGQYDDPRLYGLSHAILAPNPHNRQPWQIALLSEDRFHIYRDLTKNLPATDPFDRQLTIGMGCFLELLDLALKNRGFAADIDLFPLGDENLVAEVRLVPARQTPAEKALFDAILHRRSCKEPFADTPISAAAKAHLARYGEVIDDSARIAALKKLSIAAFEVEYKTPHTLQESVDLMRIGRSAIDAQPDGIDLGGTMVELAQLAGIINHTTLMDANSSAYAQGLALYHTILTATPNYILVRTRGNDRTQQIEAGRRWARLNLETTRLGLALHPISQALQEYKEMRPHYRAIHADFARAGETIQMFGRLGYGPRTEPAPRWGIDAKLRHPA